MDEGSTTIALAARLRKRSISSHRHSTTDNENRTLIKTKIQKIDGQYKASPTCPINNEQDRANNSSDDQDEPLIVATVPPLVQDSSKYRTRQDIYDDETGDDQQSNASSIDYSPEHQSESPNKSTIVIIQKPTQSLNDNENETTNETSVHIPTMSTRRSTRLLSEETNQEESNQPRTKTTKKTNANKASASTSSIPISIEQTPSINLSSSPNETRSTPEDTLNKTTSSSVDVTLSNNKQSQNTNDQSKVKVRLKPMPPSPQTKKNNKPATNIKNTKPIEQKPIKKPITAPKETVITPKKTTTTTIIPKKPVKTSIAKPSTNTNNSEKQSVRLPSSTSAPSKPIEKKSSDISNSTGTTKKPTETPSAKPPPVTLGKIPKLNPANKQKPMEIPTPSKSLTDQKLDLLAVSGGLSNNKETTISEKNLPKSRSPPRSNRPPQNLLENSDPFAPLSPMDLVDSTDNSLGKPPSTRYPSLLDTNPRLTTNFSRTNSIGLENTQSQSPLSPGPLSTLYPPPSPPTLSQSSRSIPPSIKPSIDTRNNQPHLLPPTNELSQSYNRKNFSTPPVLPRPSSSSNLINTQSIPPLLSTATHYQDPRSTKKTSNIWDSESSDEESEDNTNARRFFHQNMRAVDEELSKIDELNPVIPPSPADIRTEQLLKRQKKASLCLGSNSGTYESNFIEASASMDDFECVAMDLDSPKHRTQSESSDNNHTMVESNNSKNTSNGPADSKSAESTTASSTDTSKKLPFKNRPLKTTSMTLIDELKNSINPSATSKQPIILSPPSRSLSRSRSRTRSRSPSRSRTRSKSRSRSRTRSRSPTRSRSRTSSSSSSSSSRKRHGRSRHRSSKRRSSKHYQRRRSNSYDNNNERMENNNNNNNNYPPAPLHYPPHHHHPPHPHAHPHHQQQQQHWPSTRQTGSLMPGPPQPPPLQPYGHQPPVPPLLPNHPYYPPTNRSLMHPVESNNAGGRFNFPHNTQQRHHPPLMHSSYYPPAPLQPLMQTPARSHHPINRYPPPTRPFDLPPHPMAMPPNPGPYPPNTNYNQFKYESEEHQAMRRAKTGTNINNNRQGGSQQTEPNAKKKMSNPPKSNTKPSDPPEMDQLVIERDKLLAKLNEISDSGENDEGHFTHDKRSTSTNPTQPINSQDDEDEEGEISESD